MDMGSSLTLSGAVDDTGAEDPDVGGSAVGGEEVTTVDLGPIGRRYLRITRPPGRDVVPVLQSMIRHKSKPRRMSSVRKARKTVEGGGGTGPSHRRRL